MQISVTMSVSQRSLDPQSSRYLLNFLVSGTYFYITTEGLISIIMNVSHLALEQMGVYMMQDALSV